MSAIIKSSDQTFYVENTAKNQEYPFIVSDKKKGNLSCSSNCHRFKNFGMCSHITAVANVLGRLNEQIKVANAKNRKVNVSRLADLGKESLASKKLNDGQKKGASNTPCPNW